MAIELLFSVLSFLFWPAVVIGLIFMFRRRRTRRERDAKQQTLGELSELLCEVRHRISAVEDRVERLERRGAAPAAALEVGPAVAAAEVQGIFSARSRSRDRMKSCCSAPH